MDNSNLVQTICRNAKTASKACAALSANQKNEILGSFAAMFDARRKEIQNANLIDLENARQNNLKEAFVERLTLNDKRIDTIIKGIKDVIALDDIIGSCENVSVRPNGLKIAKVRIPLGVVGVIYESRPNVTCDIAALCIKSGNCAVLRGGKEAINTNLVLCQIMRDCLSKLGYNPDFISIISDTSRELLTSFMKQSEYIDVLIPRGGAGLIKSVKENASIPVIETGTGNCHAFVDESADLEMANSIIYNAKTSRVSVCNALETCLIHKNIADKFLPVMANRLSQKNVEIRGCEYTKTILPDAVPATEDDYKTEFNDYILAVKVVEDIDEAIAHISKYSSGHSEVIITENYSNSVKFTSEVDSACVYVNASTRFTDGGEFGFGSEIGISTQKMHARGPMGISVLTTNKYIILGNGQIR